MIEEQRVSRFACHMPLSTRFETLGTRGTRHAAALGLSERSDALCLAVSEERGVVSMAKDGALRELRGPDELATVIAAHVQQMPSAPKPLKELVRKDYQTKLAAIGIAIVLWLVLVHGGRQTTRRLTVPIEPTDVPHAFEATVDPPEATLSLVGPRRNFYFFGRDSARVALSFSGTKPGSTAFRTIQMADVVYPRDLTLRDVQPSRVRASLRRRADDAAAVTTPRKPPRPKETIEAPTAKPQGVPSSARPTK